MTEKETQKPASEIDSLLADVAQDSLANQQNPLIDLIRGQGQGYETFKFSVRDTATVGAYLRMKEIRRLIPASLANVKFVWERPSANSEVVGLYALKSNRDNSPRISGDVVSDARDDFSHSLAPLVFIVIDTAGRLNWSKSSLASLTTSPLILGVLSLFSYS